MTISLLINIYINDELKYAHFKSNLLDIYSIFDEIHIKIRGSYKNKCINFVKQNLDNKLITYQNLTEKDWVKATSIISKNLDSGLVFLFNEDHKINCEMDTLIKTIKELAKFKVDYMPFSFFKANRLNSFNILPLNPKQNNFIDFFDLDKNKLKLIGKISPSYYHVSLLGIFSTSFFKKLINSENIFFKFYLPLFNKIIDRIYPGKKLYILERINFILNKFNISFNSWPINTPFNLEKIWYQDLYFNEECRYGIPKNELFANFDDDNGAYGESLIKRGLYPYDEKYFKPRIVRKNLLSEFSLEFKKGDTYDLTYYNSRDRILICPVLQIEIIRGDIKINSSNEKLIVQKKNKYLIYSNLSPVLLAKTDCKVRISIFDKLKIN